MSNPAARIKEHKNLEVTNRYPDNVGDKKSGGQHYMLISAYKMEDPRMTTSASGLMKSNPNYGQEDAGGYEDSRKMVQQSVDWSCALYIPPGSLKQTISGKYAGLEQGATTIRAAGATANLLGGAGGHIANTWNQTNISAVGAVSGGGDAVSKAFQASINNITAAYEKATSWSAWKEGGKELAARAAGMAGGGGKQFMAGAGIINNQHMALVYDGPGEFREHSFSFTFWPKNHPSANQVGEIVSQFKKRMSPGGSRMTQGIDSAFWGYPDLFTIKFMIGGEVWKPMHIYRSVLKTMTVDFMGAQGTVAFHKGDGGDKTHPVATKLDLTFQETVHVTNKDIPGGSH